MTWPNSVHQERHSATFRTGPWDLLPQSAHVTFQHRPRLGAEMLLPPFVEVGKRRTNARRVGLIADTFTTVASHTYCLLLPFPMLSMIASASKTFGGALASFERL